jgi:peptidoglycan/LPS O-acetylase OafA/YrhL
MTTIYSTAQHSTAQHSTAQHSTAQHSTAQHSLNYRPDIDGLRTVAVLSVAGYHFFPDLVKGGFVGVDIFFVISGFLIGGILLDMLIEERFSLLEFYGRRVRRILPALILVMTACLAFGWFALLPDDYQNLGKHTAGGAGFIANLMFWKEAGYFDVAAERKLLLHLWSLGIEEQFYIVFPLVLWGLWRKNLRPVTCIVLLCWLSYRWNIATYKKDPIFDFYAPVTRFWELLAGVLLALWERRSITATNITASFPNWCGSLWCTLTDKARKLCFRDAAQAKTEGGALRSFISLLGLILLVLAMYNAKTDRFPGKQALIPVLGAVCLIAAGSKAWCNRALLSHKPIVWIGLISYPLYLWHWPLLSYARIILGKMPHRDFRIGLILLAFVLATLTYFCVERPVRFGKRARGIKAMALVVLLIILGGTGGTVHWHKGLENRKVVKDQDHEAIEAAQDENLSSRKNKCRKELPLPKEITACLYNDAGGKTTTLLIGDSHADVPFDAIAEFNARIEVNTLALIGYHWNYSEEKGRAYLNKVFEFLDKRADLNISKAFVMEVGMHYMVIPEKALSEEANYQRMQYMIDRLQKTGREVYVLSDNPNLPRHIKDLISNQPFRPKGRAQISVYKSDILQYREKYSNILTRLKGATIIDGLTPFCPGKTCLLTDENGLPMYSDENHLSRLAGSRFLVEHVLKSYLTHQKNKERGF